MSTQFSVVYYFVVARSLVVCLLALALYDPHSFWSWEKASISSPIHLLYNGWHIYFFCAPAAWNVIFYRVYFTRYNICNCVSTQRKKWEEMWASVCVRSPFAPRTQQRFLVSLVNFPFLSGIYSHSERVFLYFSHYSPIVSLFLSLFLSFSAFIWCRDIHNICATSLIYAFTIANHSSVTDMQFQPKYSLAHFFSYPIFELFAIYFLSLIELLLM